MRRRYFWWPVKAHYVLVVRWKYWMYGRYVCMHAVQIYVAGVEEPARHGWDAVMVKVVAGSDECMHILYQHEHNAHRCCRSFDLTTYACAANILLVVCNLRGGNTYIWHSGRLRVLSAVVRTVLYVHLIGCIDIGCTAVYTYDVYMYACMLSIYMSRSEKPARYAERALNS